MTHGPPAAQHALDEALTAVPVIAIVRLPDTALAVPAVDAVRRGGVRAIEITLTTTGALDLIRALSDPPSSYEPGGTVIGVGSVRQPSQAAAAISAGAQFLVTPTFHPGVLDVAAAAGIPVVCGALTPTELDTAAQAGAAYLKLFPASAVGPDYLRELLAPMPDLRIIPTGGVRAADVPAWAAAGARAVAAGSAVVAADLVEDQDWSAITSRAQHFTTVWPSRASTTDRVSSRHLSPRPATGQPESFQIRSELLRYGDSS